MACRFANSVTILCSSAAHPSESVNASCRSFAAMGKWGKQQKRKRGAGGSKGGQDKKEEKNSGIVQKFRYFAKAAIAPYPDEDGVPIYLGQAEDEVEFFAAGAIANTRDKTNCEFLHRIGMGICLSAATFDNGITVLEKISDVVHHMDCDGKKSLSKTGMVAMLDVLGTEKGKAFKKAVRVLNTGKTGQPEKGKVEQAVSELMDFVDKSPEDLRKALSRCASFTASTYLFSMTLLELIDMSQHRDVWAKKMESLSKQPKAVKAWTKDAGNKKKFRAAIVAAFLDKVGKHKPPASKKRKAADTTSDEGDTTKAQEKKTKKKRAKSPSDAGSDDKSDSEGTSDSKDSSGSRSSAASSDSSRGAKKGRKKRRLSDSGSEESDKKTKKRRKDQKKKNKKEKLSKDKKHRDGSAPSEALKSKEDAGVGRDSDSEESDKKTKKPRKEQEATKKREKPSKDKKHRDGSDASEALKPKEAAGEARDSDSEKGDKKIKEPSKDQKKENKKEKSPKDKKHRDLSSSSEVGNPKEDLEATYVLVAQSTAQELHCKLLELKENIGSNSDGRFPTKEIVTLIQSLPDQVLKRVPALQHRAGKLQAEDEVSNTVAKRAVMSLMNVVEEIEMFYEGQQRLNAGGSKGSRRDEKKDD